MLNIHNSVENVRDFYVLTRRRFSNETREKFAVSYFFNVNNITCSKLRSMFVFLVK